MTYSTASGRKCFWIEISLPVAHFSRPPAIPQASASELSESYVILGSLLQDIQRHNHCIRFSPLPYYATAES